MMADAAPADSASRGRMPVESTTALFGLFARRYPGRTVLQMTGALLVGVTGSFSLLAVLPLLEMLFQADGGTTPTLPTRLIAGFLDQVGLETTPATLLALIAAGFIVKGLLLFAVKSYMAFSLAAIAADYHLALIRRLVRARWAHFTHESIGKYTMALGSLPRQAAQAFYSVSQAYAEGLQALGFIVGALLVSVSLTGLGVLLGAALALTFSFLIGISHRAGATNTRMLRTLLSAMADEMGVLKSLKAMAREQAVEKRLIAHTAGLHGALLHMAYARATLIGGQEPVAVILVVAGVGGAATLLPQLEAPVLLTMAVLLYSTLSRVMALQRSIQGLATSTAAVQMLEQTIVEVEDSRERWQGTETPALRRAVALRDVSVDRGGQPVLRGVNLEIRRGSFVALAGLSGAGKTTITDLLLGLIAPTDGTVLVDDRPLATLDIAAWRRLIGYVPQEVVLLHEDVFTNVTLGDRAFDDADVERALRAAGAWDFVAALPQGTRTHVGERGTRLSGGQRQRIMIARALVHRPQLLILDEPTTAFDPATEEALCRTLRDMTGQVTIVAVSHQAAVTAIADEVWWVGEGGLRRPAA